MKITSFGPKAMVAAIPEEIKHLNKIHRKGA
ncbi:hypothetical protein SAMN05216356_10398 [Oribacterium sp. WCC10]|nr:hypothetical protein SAMN05216356_10398 [Oribacterium sp. WCC10]